MEDNTPSIAKTAFVVTLLTMGSRVLGFLREAVIAYVFGAGSVTDAYNVALRVMSTAALLIFVYLTTTFVPSYIRIREEKGDKVALQAANNSLGVSLAINVFLMIVLLISAPLILRTITGFETDQMTYAVLATNILLFKLPLLTFAYFFMGYLTARKSFIGPNFIGIPMNAVFIVVCLTLGTGGGIVGLSAASFASVIIQLLTLFIWLPKEKYRYSFSMRFNTPEIREDLKILIPALLGSALIELKAWVDTIIATHIGMGNAAAIGFSSRLLGFVSGLAVMPLAGMVYTYMSEYAAKNDTKKMLDILWKTVRVITFIVLPIVIIAMPLSFDVVSIVYERGQFGSEATLLTGAALRWYLPGLLGLSLYTFLVRFFYGLQDTKTPMLCGVAAMLINIALSVLLSRHMGIGGLTLATSIGHTLSALFLLALLRRKIGRLGFGKTAADIVKMTVCAIPCAIVVFGAGHLLSDSGAFLRFGASAAIGGAVYFAAALMLREIVAYEFVSMIKKRFGRA